MKLKWSYQAKALLNNLKDFNIEEFEKWVEENKFIVGGSWIIEYLEHKEKDNKIFRGELNDK